MYGVHGVRMGDETAGVQPVPRDRGTGYVEIGAAVGAQEERDLEITHVL